MKKKILYNILATAWIFALASSAQAANCTGATGAMSATSLDKHVSLKTNYSGPNSAPGSFQDILALSAQTSKKTRCVVVHLSAYIQPADNHMVFQVLLNGKPMQGHAPSLAGTNVNAAAISEPVHNLPSWVRQQDPLYDPPRNYGRGRENYKDVPRTVSYTFFQTVKGGTVAKIVMRAAGCCGKGAGSIIHAASLVAFH